MGKKVHTGLALGVVLVLALLVGISAWKGSDDIKNEASAPKINIAKTENNDAIKDWKDYQSEKFGYSVKYPAEFELWTPTTKKFVTPPMMQRADFLIDNGTPVSIWIMPKNFVNKYDRSDPKDHRKITVDGLEADRLDEKTDVSYFATTIVSGERYQYQILYTDDLSHRYLEKYNQMLSTFKIIK